MRTTETHRPVIGIPCTRYPSPWYTPGYGNAVSYLRAIEAAGGIPLLIHQTRDLEVVDYHERRCDALLFAGGFDLDPSGYRAPRHPRLGETDPFQDELELRLARRAVANSKPVLGICRGLQLLNVALGGTLYQDIAAEVPGAINHLESHEHGSMQHLAHPVALEEGSWLAARLGVRELHVNSLHHQALRDVSHALRVTGRAPDGLPEVVEGAGPGFLLAVQCHPEELWDETDTRWSQMFRGFVDVARQHARSR